MARPRHRKQSATFRHLQRVAVVGIAAATPVGLVSVAQATPLEPLAPPPAAAPVEASPPVEAPVEVEAQYTVVSGDWLSKISENLGIADWHELYDRNRGVVGDDPDLIFPGQVLQVGAHAAPPSSRTAVPPSSRTAVSPSPEPPPTAAVQPQHVAAPAPAPAVAFGTAIIRNSAGPVAPYTQAAADKVFTSVPGASLITIGGTRGSAIDPHGHPSGNALDWMVLRDKALGDAIVAYHVAHWNELGVEYIIWQQRILTSPNGAWKGMENRGSITANHFDHVHVNYHR